IGRPDLALQLTGQAISGGHKTAQAYFLDGIASKQVGGQEASALYDFEQASNLEPTNSQVLLSLTDTYLRQKRNADAERVAKRAITFNKDDPRAYINYGLVLAQEQKYDDARTQFESALKLNPKDASPVVLEAKSYVDQKAVPAALQTLDRALQIDPKNLEATVNKARLQASQHDVSHALGTYEGALGLVNDAEAKAAIVDEEGAFLASEKRSAEAEAALKRAIADYPNALRAHVAYGDFLAQNNQLARAEAEWTLGLGPNKDNREALGRLGEYYMRTGKPQSAVTDLKRLTDLTPDAAAFNLLGQAYAYTRQYDKSKDACLKSFALAKQPPALGCIGAADFELRNYKESAKVFDVLDRNVRRYLDANPQLVFIMGKVYENTNQRAKAVAAYKRFLAFIRPTSPAYKQVKQLIANLSKPTSANTRTKH
ncbi:MAG: tetratricopeptide repeat protein, partial [Candidatus Eremiobacteraeota bacterium]|nr:tetratricopeptide repeat protein [Candidatus Eremiobacteraeota bacterium]